MSELPRAVDPYANYTEWKRWDGVFAASDKEARYFAAEFADIPLRGRRVLEIGFGNGSFLAWAKGEGADVAGIELNEDMRDAARKNGFVAFDATLAALRQTYSFFRGWALSCLSLSSLSANFVQQQ